MRQMDSRILLCDCWSIGRQLTFPVIVDNYEKPMDEIVLHFNFVKIPTVRFKPHGMCYEAFKNEEVWLKSRGGRKRHYDNGLQPWI
jgi:hypothetical protein